MADQRLDELPEDGSPAGDDWVYLRKKAGDGDGAPGFGRKVQAGNLPGGGSGQAHTQVIPVTFETADVTTGIDTGIVIGDGGVLLGESAFFITETWTLDDAGYVIPSVAASSASFVAGESVAWSPGITDTPADLPYFGSGPIWFPSRTLATATPDNPNWYAIGEDWPLFVGVRVASDSPPTPNLTAGAGFFVVSWLDAP